MLYERAMRNLIVTLAVLAACGSTGHSDRDVAMAKQARYQGDKLQLFAAVKAATEAKYKLEKSDENTLGMQTTGRWYTPDGLSNSASSESPQEMVDKSINLTLVVELLPEGNNWVVSVRPYMLRFNAGQPKPDKLDPKDPSVPGWVTGKVDELSFAIYQGMRQYEVRAPGGNIPPGPAAPAPAAPGATPPTPEAGSGSAG